MSKGWYGNKMAHSLASRGVRSKQNNENINFITLYHVTDLSNLENIKKYGLRPKNDPHLEMKVINLADKNKIEMFKGLLLNAGWIKRPVILKVNVSKDQINNVGEGWFVSHIRINPKNIMVVSD